MSIPKRDMTLDPDGYAYILLFSDGTTKVGKTRNPAARRRVHMRAAEAAGARLVHEWISPVHRAYDQTEEALIAAAGRLGTALKGAEYFTGCDFAELVAVAETFDFTPSAPEDRAPCPWPEMGGGPSPMRSLADLALGGGLDEFVTSRREAKTSWRRIALDLLEATNRQIDITPETVRAWFPHLMTRPAA